MPPQTTFYQRIFHQDTSLLPISHQTRQVIMRRHCSNRVCLLLSIFLFFYILWYILISTNGLFRYRSISPDELAYIQAVNSSLPILQNTQICLLDKIDILFVILSSSSHFLERQSIRETWTSLPDIFDVHSQRLFIIGYHPGGNFYKFLSNEAAHEQDLLYVTVEDHLTTLKELNAYRWLEKYCPNVKYIFKTEDDLFVNPFLLHELVRELKTKPDDVNNRYLYNVSLNPLFLSLKNPENKFLFGWAYQPGMPERNNTISPYYVTRKEYPHDMYPRYCSGFGYLMNSNTRNLLTAESLKDTNPFRFPDIYISGILPDRLGFVCEMFPFTYHQGTTDDCILMINNRNKKESLLLSPPLFLCSTGRHTGQNTYSDYHKLWTELKQVYNDRLQIKN